MTPEDIPSGGNDVVRTQAFSTDGPVEVDVQLGTGSLEIELTAESGEDGVQVDLRHDPSTGGPWAHGLANALSWVNEQFGDQLGDDLAGLSGTAAAAVEQTQIEMQGRRLVVRAPKVLPLRHLPLAVTVRAPAGSEVDVRAASARVTVHGTARRIDVSATAGDVSLEKAEGSVVVRTGGGSVSIGQPRADLRVQTGGGDVRVADVAGTASVVTGTGAVRIGTVDGELSVRSGSGDVSVVDVSGGTLDLKSGSGDVRVGLHAGVLAEVHLTSATGRVASELDVQHDPPADRAPLRVRASSGSGAVSVTSVRE